MCVKHSTLGKAKDNIYFFTFSTFLVIIFLLLGTPVLFFVCLFVLFCFYASGRQKNWKMQSVHNVECEVVFFILQRVKIKMKLSSAIWMFYFSWMEEHLKCWGVIWCRIHTVTVPGIFLMDLFSSYGRLKDTNDNRNYTSAIGNWQWFLPWHGHLATLVFQTLPTLYKPWDISETQFLLTKNIHMWKHRHLTLLHTNA